MKRKFRFVSPALLCFCTLTVSSAMMIPAAGQASGRVLEQHCYRQTSGDHSFQYTWIRETHPFVKIRVTQPRDQFVTLCDPTGESLNWTFSNHQTQISAKLEDKRIRVSGIFMNQPYEDHIETNGSHWYQAPSYALSQLVLSGKAEQSFWMIRSDTLEPLKLKVVRLEPEPIEISKQMIPAHKFRLTLTGLLEPLWSGHYWFRMTDGVFLQYRGTNGPPGTPETLIQLAD